MSNLGLLNLKGLGRYSGKIRGLKCWQLDQVKVQGTCVDFLNRVWLQGTMKTACIEEWIIGGGCEVCSPRKTVPPLGKHGNLPQASQCGPKPGLPSLLSWAPAKSLPFLTPSGGFAWPAKVRAGLCRGSGASFVFVFFLFKVAWFGSRSR